MPRKTVLAAFEFPNGTLTLTEAGTQEARVAAPRARRARRCGSSSAAASSRSKRPLRDFAERLRSENHTVKRSLTDPRLFSGIGNAYSDEILHRARLSPVKLTSRLTDDEIARAPRGDARDAASSGSTACATEAGGEFPEKVTAFRPEMAVHGKFGQPCPVCGTRGAAHPLRGQRDELLPALPDRGHGCSPTARCRGCSKQDWPRRIEELEG